MAKYERRISGDFDLVLEKIKDGILEASASASLEDESRFFSEETMCAVQVYERYSAFGNNRVSLTVTLFKSSEEMIVSGITSGGSQAVFMKINTVGEETFLEVFRKTVDSI